jgi:exodeoxyribonuclease-1
LYGAFIDDADRPLMDAVRNATPEQLAELEPTFMDSRLPVLLFRYRARNWPESLAPTERALWDIYRKKRFKNGDGSASIGMREYEQGIAELLSEHGADAQHKAVLQALQAWGEAIGV